MEPVIVIQDQNILFYQFNTAYYLRITDTDNIKKRTEVWKNRQMKIFEIRTITGNIWC